MSRVLFTAVLDQSGSMKAIQEEAITGLHEYIEAHQAIDDAEVLASLVVFSSDPEVKRYFTPIDDFPPVNDYDPHGLTALNDAIGVAIDLVEEEATEEDDVVVVVITDGMENASTRFDIEYLQEKIQEAEDKGWKFIYVGTDAALVEAPLLGIDTTITWDVADTQKMYRDAVGTTMSFYTSVGHTVSDG